MRLDADGPWVVAIAEVTERPSWLKRGTPASFEAICPRYCSFGNPILRSGLVTEVSVLSPGVEPAEPLAQVLYVKPVEPKPAARVQVIYGDGHPDPPLLRQRPDHGAPI